MSHGRHAAAIIASEIRNRIDGLKLFRALDPKTNPEFNDQAGLMRCPSYEIAAGGGNRSGKSVPCFARAAAIARNMPITTTAGEVIHVRPERFGDAPLTMWFIGLQENHIGQTLYRLLFRAGAYQIIRDQHTREWRAFEPWNPDDYARRKECKPAPPLIPASEIEEIAWKSPSKHIFESVKLKNGTIMYAFASTADVKQGDPVHYIHIDEGIKNPSDYAEWQMRTLDYEGVIVWSAWPQEEPNEALTSLWNRAESEAEQVKLGMRDVPRVSQFTFSTTGNPFIPKLSLERVLDGSMGLTDEQVKARIHGIPSHESPFIYASFDRKFNSAITDDPLDKVSEYLKAHGEIPGPDWTHELILDPGTLKPGVLFGAIPPPSLWDGNQPVLVIYDEIYTPRVAAPAMARLIRAKIPDGVTLNRIVIDNQMGRQIQPGMEKPVWKIYADAMEEAGITMADGDSLTCVPGNPDFASRRMQVEMFLKPQVTGRPTLRFVTSRCWNAVNQMATNRLKVINHVVIDKPQDNQKDDLRVCVEYWCSSRPRWVPRAEIVRGKKDDPNEMVNRLRERMGVGGSEKSGFSIHVGPGAM